LAIVKAPHAPIWRYAGAPGVDGVTFEQIDASGVDAWLAGLHEENLVRISPVNALLSSQTRTSMGKL
jgi:hypothetical protein